MRTAILGARIREHRRSIGITQAELARRIGVPSSYLNLIERNKRGIAGPLLRRTAEALDIRLDELDGAVERRLLETLNEVAHLPDLKALGVEAESAGELIGRYPGWARALAALARSESNVWEVPYLPIAPANAGRTYEELIRINSQTGGSMQHRRSASAWERLMCIYARF